MAGCAKCGACCRAIHLSWTPERIQEELAKEGQSDGFREDAAFMREHWHSITEEEAERRLPGLTTVPKEHPDVYTNVYEQEGHFYECDQFNPETNECMAHDTRPPVCSGYPWYGGDRWSGKLWWLPQCSFWHDLPREQWREGIVPLPDPLVIGEGQDGGE